MAPWHPVAATGGAAWSVLVALMLDWHLGMLERPDGRQLGGLGVPNLLALGRLAVVPVIPLLPPAWIAAVLVAAAATDVLDGALARRRDQVTRLGRWLDGAADAAVAVTAAFALAVADVLPAWLAAAVAARHVLQWGGVASLYFARAGLARDERVVSARIPGAALACGLVLSPFAATAGHLLVGVGALGGVAAVVATAQRVALPPRETPISS